MSDKKSSSVKILPTGCSLDCGGTCVLKAHVENGVIKHITTDDRPETETIYGQLRACVRGRAWRQRVYAPDRLKYPMKRVGERGEGRFERISWDEALDTVANEIKRVVETYGPLAIFEACYFGSTATLHSTISGPVSRLLTMLGGRTTFGKHCSNEATLWGSMYTYGDTVDGMDARNFLDSKLIILWGANPAEASAFGCNAMWYLARAHEKGVKIITVDPIYTNTAAVVADQWIPIRPNTDTAMMLAMAYVIITENLQDQAFLDKYTVGFEKFRDYVLGETDGVPKTPQWAEEKTGVPMQTIRDLAIEYATVKPAALIGNYAPGRTHYGGQYARAAAALQAMTGNIGIKGGSSWVNGYGYGMGKMRMGVYPVEGDTPGEEILHYKSKLRFRGKGVEVVTGKWAEAILEGKKGGYPSDIKMVYIAGMNPINQLENTNKGVEALKSVEFVVVQDQFMTPTAKFADILLPANTHFERNDIAFPPRLTENWMQFMNKAVDPLHESKTDLEICEAIAERLGLEGFNPHTEEEWLRMFVEESDVPDYEEFRRTGVYEADLPEPWVAFREFRADPEKNPLPTPSGKIEIYSQTLADMGIPPIPTWFDDWEGPQHPLAKKYPLQLVTTHKQERNHSQFYNIPWLRERYTHEVWINTLDAEARGIKDGDLVRVFNDVGSIRIKAKVTERIVPGVVRVYQGAWYDPDKEGVDNGGCANVLVRDNPSPFCGCRNYNTALVQVRKEE